MSSLATRRNLISAGVVVVAVAAIIALSVFLFRPADAAKGDPVEAGVPVALSAANVPADTRLGVVVTLGSGSGAAWKDAAQGAAVAAHRFTLSGTPIALSTADDRGTAEGARKAVEKLVSEGVAGIIVATDGEQVDGALEAAADAGVPVILPYYDGKIEAEGAAWRTAPTGAQVSKALAAALAGAKRPLLIDAGGGAPDSVDVDSSISFAPGADPEELAADVARRTGVAEPAKADGTPGRTPVADPADAILLSGNPTQQATVVHALQSAKVTVPLVLTPGATSPAFASGLAQAGGTVSGRLSTVGANAGDAAALRPDDSGRAMSGFLAGLRVLAQDKEAKNLTGDMAFSEVANAADSRSHDAVVALVRAVSTAGSNDPAKVAKALGTLKPGPADGIAGPALDFTRPDAMDGDPVVLHFSAQDLGLRPTATGDGATASWFARPSAD
ncbi:ABC transporter substrate-binding protein [Paeniglutamicibacter sp. ABSL32-1]|uniref:ABC transporter substrate-binding protein n=1 Tax=Paeniglutamicibacter quisquiliarum TaxID=2849498 RepID=UPI001C2CF436|nr:ABC transporter substrate-binding protein [Paeniglutamicibacter quisquiliarum]MBV1779386.1 ABC transporter substrate-binding protein [Paeniglutamicibacter quisquiliarum]